MSERIRVLRNLSRDIVEYLERIGDDERQRLPPLVDYHGFAKARFDQGPFAEILRRHGFRPEDVQVELVHVGRDLTDEVHCHLQSDAIVTVLGERPRFRAPSRSFGYLDQQWTPVHEGQEVVIPAGTPHGFTRVGSTGGFHFLSVQSPPIVKADGEDDYVKVAAKGNKP